ncbi:WhiB family transcriptional regulator, redox-sensing transcriptional regulator [Nocardiopsis flavescens]|uniref:WhiB family transcriptional regulator, redox-sensing transcriptional regulator n=1 Tax=Nocardiopsis flavescens TaxID=758803 RepID=A0A1M6QJ31_9ACTN|nr:WhiB family transcriptional regulator [Nocardiopsis flavescens]SHK20251.1 WhiB family transcriptional regulator, redox-sensing transcriptional regulator [Nocardiopsis flavescens]
MSSDQKGLSTAQLRAELASNLLPCTSQPELFFEPDTSDRFGEAPAVRTLRERSAKVLCDTCSARAMCLELAVREQPVAGVWGGLTADELRYRKAA